MRNVSSCLNGILLIVFGVSVLIVLGINCKSDVKRYKNDSDYMSSFRTYYYNPFGYVDPYEKRDTFYDRIERNKDSIFIYRLVRVKNAFTNAFKPLDRMIYIYRPKDTQYLVRIEIPKVRVVKDTAISERTETYY